MHLAFGLHPVDGVDGQEGADESDAPACHDWNPHQKTWLFQNESDIFLQKGLVWGYLAYLAY